MTPEEHGIPAQTVRSVRTGNAIGPGLALFTGISFLVYLLVKLAAGTVAPEPGILAQIAVSIVLFAWGLAVILRGRFHFVVLETESGSRRIKGLSKAEQTALAANAAPHRQETDSAS